MTSLASSSIDVPDALARWHRKFFGEAGRPWIDALRNSPRACWTAGTLMTDTLDLDRQRATNLTLARILQNALLGSRA